VSLGPAFPLSTIKIYSGYCIQEIIKSVKRDLVEKQRAILGVLDQMSEIEEAAAASREEEYSIEV